MPLDPVASQRPSGLKAKLSDATFVWPGGQGLALGRLRSCPRGGRVSSGHSGAGPSSQPASVRAERKGSDVAIRGAVFMSNQNDGAGAGVAAVMSQRRAVPLMATVAAGVRQS